MTLIVEDGTGVIGAESYNAISAIDDYAVRMGLTFTGGTPEKEAAARRGAIYLDAKYGSRFTGKQVKPRIQGLAFPRTGSIDRDGNAIASDSVPIEILNAHCECSIREAASPNSLSPDQERGGLIKSLKAGSVAIEYADGATSETVMLSIDNALTGLIGRQLPGQIISGKVTRA